jgi:lipoprotein-anchoring transpeptidase ErfK/SrfK
LKDDRGGIYDFTGEDLDTDEKSGRKGRLSASAVKSALAKIGARLRGGPVRARDLRSPMFPRWLKVVCAWSVLAIGLAFLVGAGLELASSGRIAKGVTVDGVPVGGMTRDGARKVIEEKVKPVESDIVLTFEGKQYPIDLKAVDSHVDVDGMVQEAYLKGKRSPALLRITRRLLGSRVKSDVPVIVTFSGAKLKNCVTVIAGKINRKPTSASISVASGSPEVIPSRNGVRVRAEDTIRAVSKALPTVNRAVPIVIDPITPEVVESDIGKIVVIHQKEFRLYLFDHEREVNSYLIAVGMPQYPTPNGRFHITYKEKNPTWLPTSEWAKDKRGVPQPPGPDNPLGGYWMDLGGGIGIHATPFPKSLGEQASHGCIRMAPDGAEALFNAVKVGTPVFIID